MTSQVDSASSSIKMLFWDYNAEHFTCR
jgi:hypothetical protein